MRIAVAQTCTGIDPAASADAIAALIDRAAAAGAAMLFTPEMSNIVDRDRTRAAASIVAEADDPVLAAARAAAARHAMSVQLGSLALRGEGQDRRHVNRGFFIGPGGEIMARYDKLHLFDIDLPDGTSWRESAAYRPGGSAAIVATPWSMIGLSICYDLRFAALYAALAEAGANVLAVPAAFTVPTGRAHWHALLRARAIENAAFVVAAAQSGVHADGRETYGHSLVIDPWGRVLLDLGEGEGLGIVDLDLAEVRRVRASLPALAHRRAIPAVRRYGVD